MKHPTLQAAVACVAAAGLLVGAADLEAQRTMDERQFSVELRSGASVPGSDLADQVDTGFSFGASLGFPLAERVRLAVEGDVGMMSEVFRDDEVGTGEAAQFFAGDLRLWHYGGALSFDLADPDDSPWTAVLHGGLGATTIDPERIRIVGEEPALPDIEDPETQTRFTANLGLGLGYSVSRNADLFVDGKAYSIFVEDSDFEFAETLDDQIGETWWTFPIQAGVRFRMQ